MNFSNFDKFLKKNKEKKIFLLTGKNSYFKTGFNIHFEKKYNKKKFFIYYKKKILPDILELKMMIKKVNHFKPDIILAVGGGCVMDYAKILSVSYSFKKFNIKKLLNTNFKKKLKLITIPTTAGSGAEATPGAVIYSNKIKYSVEHHLIKPDKFFLIPQLVLSGSKKIKASSGFDAFAQCIESVFSKKANTKSINFAIKGLKLLDKNFLNFYKNSNLKNAKNTLLGSNFSGKAIAISKTTAPHALSYPFSTHYNISHGYAVSLTLAEIIKFNYENMNLSKNTPKIQKKFDQIFKITKSRDIKAFITYVKNLKKKINFKNKLSELGINLSIAYPRIIKGINPNRLKNNPVDINLLQIKKILEEIR